MLERLPVEIQRVSQRINVPIQQVSRCIWTSSWSTFLYYLFVTEFRNLYHYLHFHILYLLSFLYFFISFFYKKIAIFNLLLYREYICSFKGVYFCCFSMYIFISFWVTWLTAIVYCYSQNHSVLLRLTRNCRQFFLLRLWICFVFSTTINLADILYIHSQILHIP